MPKIPGFVEMNPCDDVNGQINLAHRFDHKDIIVMDAKLLFDEDDYEWFLDNHGNKMSGSHVVDDYIFTLYDGSVVEITGINIDAGSDYTAVLHKFPKYEEDGKPEYLFDLCDYDYVSKARLESGYLIAVDANSKFMKYRLEELKEEGFKENEDYMLLKDFTGNLAVVYGVLCLGQPEESSMKEMIFYCDNYDAYQVFLIENKFPNYFVSI